MSHTVSLAPQHTDRSVSWLSARGLGLLAYGTGSYALGVAALVAMIGSALGALPFSPGPVWVEHPVGAALFDVGLLVAFALQHSVMARKAFKARWIRWIHPSMERATYVLATGVVLLPLLALWQPVDLTLWSVEGPVLRAVLRGVAAAGWAYLFLATFAIDHFELFGLQQVWRGARGEAPVPPPFVERWMYRFDRHPIMTGMAVGLWVTPEMTGTHLVFAVGMTLYAMVGVHFEERALRRELGEVYEDYRRRVPSIVPLPFAR